MSAATGLSAQAATAADGRPLIAHIIFRLGIGGLENGLVNLINTMPADRFRHAIVCIDDYTDFARRIRREDVGLHALHKREGHDLGLYGRLWRLLRRLRPAIVHTRNVGALECLPVAAAAGVPARVHGEHGWDVADLHGTSRRYAMLRRVCLPFATRCVTVSRHIQDWLERDLRVPAGKVRQIYNGVDVERFSTTDSGRRDGLPADFAPEGTVVIGTVGRMQEVKNPLGLVDAFIELVRSEPAMGSGLRLVMVGDGPLRQVAMQRLEAAALDAQAWLPGPRDDVPDLLRACDVFVLPSLNEGISNTILEAMACGLPVVATDVGGNPELVVHDQTGLLVPTGDVAAMAGAIGRYVDDPQRRRDHGRAARRCIEDRFSLGAMVAAYLSLYEGLLARGTAASAA